MAAFIAARTSGGRSVDVRTMSETMLSKNAGSIPSVYGGQTSFRDDTAIDDTAIIDEDGPSTWPAGRSFFDDQDRA